MGFFKTFFTSCLGAFVAIILFFLLLFSYVVGSVSGLMEDEVQTVKGNSVLHLHLDAQITEQQLENPFDGLPIPGGVIPTLGLLQLKEAIAKAKTDPHVAGIYLDVSHPMAGFSTLEEIRESLVDFKKGGKWVLAYNEVMSEKAYYLASVSDRVYLNPEGEVEFNGLTIEIGFYKKLLDKLEIKPEVFRVGEFKSAVEPFLLEKMSQENRMQLTELVQDLYGHMLQQMATSRDIALVRLKEISDKMEVRNAATAVGAGLVDSLIYTDQFHDVLRGKLGLDKDGAINFVSYNKYRKSYGNINPSDNEIAVIVADGSIMPGKADPHQQIIGADTFVEEIRKARENKKVKAIVLRINSPGGEYISSDRLWREIILAKAQKPVMASMSDFAASGGYYIAMACDTIVALPTTISGSIGIFGLLFDMSSFLDNKLGITFDEVKTGDFGDPITITRPLTQAEKDIRQGMLNEYYEGFLKKAAEGRHMGKEDIRKVAAGRVWTGNQALGIGLVDKLGGFEEAVRLASEKAGIGDDYRLVYYPKSKPLLLEYFSSLDENAKTNAMKYELGEHFTLYSQWKRFSRYGGVQARIPFEMDIR